jgi:hypothetical protein
MQKEASVIGGRQLWLKLRVGDDVVALRITTPTTLFLSFF